MLKIALRIYLLANIIALFIICLLHEQLSVTPVRFLSCAWTASLFAIPGIIILNGIFRFIQSLRLSLAGSWIMLIISILLVDHLAISLLVLLDGVGMDMVEVLRLIVNSSVVLAMLFQFFVISHLFKSFHHESKQRHTAY
jgi:hypothetical protein